MQLLPVHGLLFLATFWHPANSSELPPAASQCWGGSLLGLGAGRRTLFLSILLSDYGGKLSDRLTSPLPPFTACLRKAECSTAWPTLWQHLST